jgi:WD40-like Beta Propeller Repeat
VRHRNDSTCTSDECPPHGEIYVANADGSGQARLTNGSGDEGPPTWTSDGAALVFASSRNVRGSGREELYAIRPDGSCLTWLTNGTETPRAPDWQPGSGGLPESLGCGAVPREPTGLFTPRGAGYWLGQIGPANRLLSTAPEDDDAKVLIYDDCARFDPLECGLPVQIQNRSSCRRYPLMYDAVYSRARFEVRRGALVYYNDGETGEGADVHTGSRTVTIFTDDPADVPATIDALRPLPSGEPVQTLEPPRFSARVLRQVELARRLRTPAKLARRLDVSRAKAAFILKFAAALEPFGKLQPADC